MDRKKTLRTCLLANPTTIDSRRNENIYSSFVNFLIYEGLTQLRKDGGVDMALAESVDISADGRTYTFHLRNAQWSDGQPITAYDFEHSWRKSLTPSFAAACPYLFFPIKNAAEAMQGKVSPEEVGIKAVNAKTFRVELENPTPYFLNLIGFCNFYPIPSHFEGKNPSWAILPPDQIPQSGPFRLTKWEQNKALTLEKNPHYWNAKNIHVDAFSVHIIPNERTALQLFENGEMDFISTVTTPLPLEDLAMCKKSGLLQVASIGGLFFCTFNTEKFPFNNVNIRKALSLAINRSAITENITQLSEVPATRFIPPVLLQNEERELFIPYDADLAKKLFAQGLQELGAAPKDIAIVLSFANKEQTRKIAQVIQRQWKEVLGIDLQLYESDPKSIIKKHMSHDYQAGLDEMVVQYSDPSNILDRFKFKTMLKNLPAFENGDYIAELDAASCAPSAQARLSHLLAAEKILADEMPIAPIFYHRQGALVSPHFVHLDTSPIGNTLFKNAMPQE